MTENALLNKAGRLAAEEDLILNDKRIPDSMAVKMIKPLASEEKRLVKRLRTGATVPIAYSGTEQPEGMVDTPAENLLKQIIKGVNKDPTVPIIIKQEATTPVKKKPSHLSPRSRRNPNPPRQVLKRHPKVPNLPFDPNHQPLQTNQPRARAETSKRLCYRERLKEC